MSEKPEISIYAGYESSIGSVEDMLKKASHTLLKDIEDAVKQAIIRATVRGRERAHEEKIGKRRTWLTKAARKEGKTLKSDLGNTSPYGYVPVDTGILWRSIRLSIRGRRSDIGFKTQGLIFSDVSYAPAQEAKRGFFKAGKAVAEKAFEEVFAEAIKKANNRVR